MPSSKLNIIKHELTLVPLRALLFSWSIFRDFHLGLQKDDPITSTKTTGQQITLEEVRALYGHLDNATGVSGRGGLEVPLGVTPLWDSAYIYDDAGYPIILTAVDTNSVAQDARHGGNLAFFKNAQGQIKSLLLVWQADSNTTYNNWKAPMFVPSSFTGLAGAVDERDTLRRMVRLESGLITSAKYGAISVNDVAVVNDGSGAAPNTVSDRDREPRYSKWDWWYTWMLLHALNGGGSGDPTTILIDPTSGNGSGGNPDHQSYTDFQVKCNYVRGYIGASETYPPEYYQINYTLCEMLHELDLGHPGDEGFCLFKSQNTGDFDIIAEYWNASDKSPATAARIKGFLSAKCTSDDKSTMMAQVVKQMYRLDHISSIDLWQILTDECGHEFVTTSECVKEQVHNLQLNELQTRFNLTTAQVDWLRGNLPVVGQLWNFVTDNTTKPSLPPFVLSVIGQMVQHSLTFVTVDDLDVLFDEPEMYNAYETYLDQDPNATEEEKKTAVRMVMFAPNDPISDLSEKLNCFDVDVQSNLGKSHKVTLYVDQPKANSDNSSDSKEKAGHTWLNLEQIDQNGVNTNLSVGFYPADFASPCKQFDTGAFNNDAGHNFDVSVTFEISGYAFTQMVNTMGSGTTPIYNLSSMNCTTWAVQKLSAAGINVPQNVVTSLPAPGFTQCRVEGLTPGRIGEDLRSYQLPTGATKNTTGGNGPSSTTCQ